MEDLLCVSDLGGGSLRVLNGKFGHFFPYFGDRINTVYILDTIFVLLARGNLLPSLSLFWVLQLPPPI